MEGIWKLKELERVEMVEDATKQRSKQRYTRKRKCHGKRKKYITMIQSYKLKNQWAHSSINSAPELVEDGAAAFCCEATTTSVFF